MIKDNPLADAACRVPTLIAAALVASAILHAQQPRLRLPSGIEVARDVVYATTPEKELTLDVYHPSEDGPALPLVVWVHGGGWQNGSKDAPRRAIGLLSQGYVVASINYRLTGDAIFPAQINDCKAAIRWLRAHAADYRIDPKHIGVWGSSAGGHLVALLGTSGDVADLEGEVGGNLDQSSRVQAVVDYFGPTDFRQMDARSISDRIVHDSPDSPESLLIGGPIQEFPDKVARANPITYVTSDDPPFFIVHGDKDPLVPHHQSEMLLEALQKAGVESSMYTVVGGGHGSGGNFSSHALASQVLRFLDKTLK